MTPSLFVSACTVVVEYVPWVRPRRAEGGPAGQVADSLGGGAARRQRARLHGVAAIRGVDARAVAGRVPMRRNWRAPSRITGRMPGRFRPSGNTAASRTLVPGNPKADEQGRILQLLERGLPDGPRLLLLAPHVDKRGRGYKKLSGQGCVVDLSVERDRSGRIRRESLAAFLDQHLRRARKKIDPRAREAVLARCGNEPLGRPPGDREAAAVRRRRGDRGRFRRGGDLHRPVRELGFRPDGFPGAKGCAPGPGLS